MDKNAKIYVAGHRGLVGSALVRKLQSEGFRNLVLRTSKELDLKNPAAVRGCQVVHDDDVSHFCLPEIYRDKENRRIKSDGLAKSRNVRCAVIPVKTGIQELQ